MFKSMPRLFGVLDSYGGHVDVSKTLRGAKNYARTESIKEGGKWKDNK